MNMLTELMQIFIYVFLAALVNPVFWMVVLLIYLQYRRIAGMERRLFGRAINKVRQQVVTSVAFGALGGFLVSAVLLLLGLSLEQIGLYFIWPVVILLLLIHPRFLCFAYAGGIIGTAVLVVRLAASIYPALATYSVIAALLKIHLPALLLLIGLLHLVESLLIRLEGHKGFTPLYYKKSDEGEVIGGFSMQRFWPMPLVALMVSVVLQADIAGVSMPEWWPLLKSTVQPGAGETLQYMAVPVVAGLGYADLALSSTPREKSLFSAQALALYSLALLSVALAAVFYPLFAIPGVLLAPLGHEWLIHYSNKLELSRSPLYRDDSRGAQVMMVLPGTAADRAGLKQGDIIQTVNGFPVSGFQEMLARIEDSYFMVLLEGLRGEKVFSVVFNRKIFEPTKDKEHLLPASPMPSPIYAGLHRAANLGLIMAPSRQSLVYVETRRISLLWWLRGLVRKR
ncbi:MAG: PDZ domain-containing protein [Dethiobacter sp.]|jgi:hypothetical protein|nr:PDZ domain-containing protein [Dethiobacter sp.]